jgi:hypothetical protein
MPWPWASTAPPRRWTALWLELRGEHSSNLREYFASFSTRLCAMSHISGPKRIFFPPNVATFF